MSEVLTYPGEVFAHTPDFDPGIRVLLPRYEEMLEAIAHCLPLETENILELGCGTGELSLKVLQRCPGAKLVAVDYSPRMLAYAQTKLTAAGLGERVTWIEADMGDWAAGNQSLPNLGFTACVSSLAIHHLSHGMKAQVFAQIYTSLVTGGCFWNADPLLPSSAELSHAYSTVREVWASSQGTTLAQVRAKIGSSPSHGHSSQDQLASLIDHLNMLSQCGFQALDVPWKYYGLAVFGGYKL